MSNYLRYFVPNATVFVTMVTQNRNPILIKNIKILRNSLKSVKQQYEIIAGCIMPDHIHILIKPDNMNDLPKVITSIKYGFSKHLPKSEDLSESNIKRKEKGIWQRRYYDHIIRDENDLHKHLDYIHYNSYKHYNIAPKDWEYSSFNWFVQEGLYEKDWLNVGDKYNILDMNIE